MFIDDDEGTDDALLTHQTLIDTQERLGSLLDLMPTGLIIHQAQGILYANKRAQDLLEVAQTQLVGQHFLDFLPEEAYQQCSDKFMAAFLPKAQIRFSEFELSLPSGSKKFIKASAGHLPWEGTGVIQILLEDVTELKQQEEKLRKLTYCDPLTEMFNRRYFIEESEKKIQTALKNSTSFSLIIFDVDHFKKVNDTYGHLAGDEALKMVAQAWHENSRHSPKNDRDNDGTLCRIGGEEFAIYLNNCTALEAKAVAERVRTFMEEHPVTFEDLKFNISASFGITELKPTDKSIDDLTRRADIALYRAKESGRNRSEVELHDS